jgi:two-component system, response regulator PdtaR
MFSRPRTGPEAVLIEGRDGPAESASSNQSRSTAKACILLVEDDFLVGMEVEAGLEEAGYQVAGVAATAEEALELAASHRPALVVMDIRLASERDGIDAALDIFRTLGIRSLFASAHVDAQVRARAEAARPLGWVAKPYRVETLLAAVGEALNEV